VWEAGFGSGGVWFSPDGGVFYLTDPANGRALAYDPDDGEPVESRDITNVPVQDFRIILWTADLLRRVFLGPFSFVVQDVATGVFGPQVAIPDLMFALLAGAF
jgi:hypothetical protein